MVRSWASALCYVVLTVCIAAIDDKNKPTDNNPSNVNHERSSVVKRPQLTVDVKEIQLTPPDIAMMRTMAKYMAGSVVVFPIGTYISNRALNSRIAECEMIVVGV